MRYLILSIIALFWGVCATGQTRSYSSNASKTFVLGLDSYFFGEEGTLTFQAGGKNVEAALISGDVKLGGTLLSSGEGDSIVGVHDFSGNGVPELMVARREGAMLNAEIYTLRSGEWKLVEKMAAEAKEIRIFRQVVSIRSGDALLSWTWHGDKFDFKASDGRPKP